MAQDQDRLGPGLATLPDLPFDPLAPFHLNVKLNPDRLRQLAKPERLRPYRIGQFSYQHFRLNQDSSSPTPLLPAPAGMKVLEGDFFFSKQGELAKASLMVRTDETPVRAEKALRVLLGTPTFEVAIPGEIQRLVGWKSDDGMLIARFCDLPVFQVTVSPSRADDDLAESHQILFDGLVFFSRRLAAGDPPRAVLDDYLRLVFQESRTK